MSNHRHDLLELHHAAVVAGLLGARPRQADAAAHDAEPESHEPQRSGLRRLVAAVRARRSAGARPETTRV